jgi:hypothetical protein
MVKVPLPPRGVLSGSETCRSRCVEDAFDSAAKARRRLRLLRPDRFEDREHMLSGDLIDRQAANRSSIDVERHGPLGAMLLVSPARSSIFQEAICELAEIRCAGSSKVPLCDRVALVRSRLTQFCRLRPSVGQRHRLEAADSHLTLPAVLAEHEDPALGSAAVDKEVEAAAVGVATRLGKRIDLPGIELVDLPNHDVRPSATPAFAPAVKPDSGGRQNTSADGG